MQSSITRGPGKNYSANNDGGGGYEEETLSRRRRLAKHVCDVIEFFFHVVTLRDLRLGSHWLLLDCLLLQNHIAVTESYHCFL